MFAGKKYIFTCSSKSVSNLDLFTPQIGTQLCSPLKWVTLTSVPEDPLTDQGSFSAFFFFIFFFFPFGCSVWLVGGILVSWPGFEPEGHVLTSLSSLFSTTTLLQSWLRPHRSPICIGCYFIFLSPLSSLSSPASTLLPWLPSPPVSLTRYSPQCFLSYCLQHDIRLSRKVPHEFYVLGATQPFHICSLRFFPEELSKVGFIILLLQMRKQTWSIESLHPHGVSSRALFWTNSRSVLYTSLPSPPNWGEQGPS